MAVLLAVAAASISLLYLKPFGASKMRIPQFLGNALRYYL